MSLTASTSGCIRPSFKLSKVERGVGGKLHSAKAKPYFCNITLKAYPTLLMFKRWHIAPANCIPIWTATSWSWSWSFLFLFTFANNHRDTILQLWIFRPMWLDHVTSLVMDCYNQKMAATCANSNVTSREKSSQSESAGTLCIVPLRSAPGCEFKSTKQRQAKLQKNRFTIKSFSIWIIHNRDNLSC